MNNDAASSDCIELHACGRTDHDRALLCASIIGVSVIGAYLLASGAAFAEAVPQLCALAKALRTDVGDDSLLLHIDDTSGKVRTDKLDMQKASCVLHLQPHTTCTFMQALRACAAAGLEEVCGQRLSKCRGVEASGSAPDRSAAGFSAAAVQRRRRHDGASPPGRCCWCRTQTLWPCSSAGALARLCNVTPNA